MDGKYLIFINLKKIIIFSFTNQYKIKNVETKKNWSTMIIIYNKDYMDLRFFDFLPIVVIKYFAFFSE